MNLHDEFFLKDEAAMLALGAQLATHISFEKPQVIFLKGDLGSGKTTFVRGFLRALGYEGLVKSPTYTLVESYDVQSVHIHHWDLYRLKDPGELAFVGLQEYEGIFLVEWPEKGGDYLPSPDIIFSFSVEGDGRRVQVELHDPKWMDSFSVS